MSNRLFVATALLFCLAQAAPTQTLSRAYCGKNGRAHLVYSNGTARILPAEPKQVGCEDISIAADQHTVGWSVLVDNCCTSYPIPISVVLYRDGKKRVISPGQMIFEWHFVNNGDRVAVLSGPVHGSAAGADLYDARNGKAVATWDGQSSAPEWADGWQEQFEPRKPESKDK